MVKWRMGIGILDSECDAKNKPPELSKPLPVFTIVDLDGTRSKPAYTYLGSLKASGRRTMRGVLESVAAIGGLTLDTLDWTSLRYEQITLIRTN